MGPIIVILIRIIVPLSILRWPLAGALLSMLVDTIDVVLITLLNMGDFENYHSTDKYLDIYFISLEAYKSLFWQNILAKRTNIILFVYRAIGFILFEITQIRPLLLIFPNLFQNFYIFYLAYQKVTHKDTVTSKRNLVIILTILLIPKLVQEYLLHFLKVQPWNWLKITFLN